jgi:hypothetical protein
MAYIVTFSVEPPREAGLIEAIKALGDWADLTPTTYLLQCEVEPGSLMEALQPMLGPKDSLWVFPACGPWAGYGDVLVDELVVAWVGPDALWVPRDWDEATQSRP